MVRKILVAGSGRVKALGITIVLTLFVPFNSATSEEEKKFRLEDIAWISGAWEGVGPNDFESKEPIYSVWSSPIEGTLSWTFRYNTPETGHVHYAFTVVEETEDGVYARGIHFGRNFRNFEENNWVFKMVRATSNEVRFDCIENCRVKSVSFELTAEGQMLEKYLTLTEPEKESIFSYKRISKE